MKFTSVWTLFWLANEEARKRIGVDAVRSVGSLRMIRREVNGATPAAGLRSGLVAGVGQQGATEVEGNTVPPTSVAPIDPL